MTQASAVAPPNIRLLPTPTPAAATGTATTIIALPVPVDLAIYQGDDFEMTVTVTEADGAPAVLTGCIPLAQIRTSAYSDPPIASFLANVDVADPSTISLVLPAATAALLPSRTVYDLQITTPTGRISTLIAGTIATTPEVSK